MEESILEGSEQVVFRNYNKSYVICLANPEFWKCTKCSSSFFRKSKKCCGALQRFWTDYKDPVFGGIPSQKPWEYNLSNLRVFIFKDGKICLLSCRALLG